MGHNLISSCRSPCCGLCGPLSLQRPGLARCARRATGGRVAWPSMGQDYLHQSLSNWRYQLAPSHRSCHESLRFFGLHLLSSHLIAANAHHVYYYLLYLLLFRIIFFDCRKIRLLGLLWLPATYVWLWYLLSKESLLFFRCRSTRRMSLFLWVPLFTFVVFILWLIFLFKNVVSS